MTERMGDATVHGDISDEVLDRLLNIAQGVRREDKNWVNRGYTGDAFLQKLAKFERGVKDGACILQGSVVEPAHGQRGVQRVWKNVYRNYLMMFDHDTGATVDEIAEQIRQQELFCVLWTTHSHMKPESWIAEAKVLAWMKANKISGSEPTHRQVLEFLRFSQKIHGKFLTDAKVVRRDLIEGGRKFLVSHAPLPRLRSLFMLKDVFDFGTRAGSQKQVCDEWKALYAGVSVKLDIPYDPSCVDPSRLMYLPRIADGADITQHEIRIIGGAFLDLATVSPVIKTRGASGPNAPTMTPEMAEVQRRFTEAGGTSPTAQGARDPARTTLSTTGLQAFLKREGRFFNAADFMYATAPDGQRHDYGDGKMDFRCPNEDDHTDANEQDRGFFVTNYTHGDGSWNMRCPHTTCLSASAEDRAWFLDKFCVDNEIKHANELHEFCDLALLAEEEEARAAAATEAQQQQTARVQAAVAPGAVELKIAALAAMPDEERAVAINEVIEMLATRWHAHPDKAHEVKALLAQTAAVAGRNKADLVESAKARKHQIAESIRATAALASAAADDPSQTVPDDLTMLVPLWPAFNEEWTDQIVTAAIKAQLERSNGEEKPPRLYRRKTQKGDAGVIRIIVHPRDNELIVEEMDEDRWRSELERVITLKKQTMTGRKPMSIPGNYISSYRGRADKLLPPLERVVRVPIFTESGSLLTERGYDPETQVFLDPMFEIIPVPVSPTPNDVDTAIELLSDALTDFPFSDSFNGEDPLPIKMHDADSKPILDSTGHPLPNFERGKGSFANTMAMILQPFVQHMIKGPAPAFHIGKASPGTGAGYLMDVVFAIAEGTRAVINVMSDNNEEFKKQITASLMEGAPIIFIDNINRKVDSGALAAALTSGTWSDRILGVSKNCRIDVRSVWVMAGNEKLDFTPELYRRNVPIRLDAKTPNPAQDRKKDFFKHFPLHGWLDANRPRLVWACHVLVAHWLDLGKPAGTVTMNSFDNWAAILGGILECAGIDGFLSNIPTYLETKNEDDHSTKDFAKALYAQYQEHPFTSDAALQIAKDPLGNVRFGLVLDPSKGDGALKQQFGRLFKADMEAHTFTVANVDSAEGRYDHTLVKKRYTEGMKYQFIRVFEKRSFKQ